MIKSRRLGRPPVSHTEFEMNNKESNVKDVGTATLNYGNQQYEFPVYGGTIGPDVVDIRKLYGQTGMFTYDPGFTSTASCESALTFIDGDEGVLLHRGYPIEQLAEHSSFMEVCYLLLNGELPTPGRRWRISTTPSPATRCCTSSSASCSAVSAATRIRWRSCAAWSARFPLSITTSTDITDRASARSPATA